MRPTRCGSPCEDKTGRLKYRNLFGLSTSEVCPTNSSLNLLVSSYLTFSLSPRGTEVLAATWFSVALSVTKTFLFMYPSFQMADHPVLPGLSSPDALHGKSGRTTCT